MRNTSRSLTFPEHADEDTMEQGQLQTQNVTIGRKYYSMQDVVALSHNRNMYGVRTRALGVTISEAKGSASIT